MPVTKITVSIAMRARDVSRPHEEHLAEAAAHADTARHAEGTSLKPAPSPAKSPAPEPALSRRRRRRDR